MLTHHETASVKTIVEISNNYSSEHPLEKQLFNKFKLNPFVAIGNPFFPDKCLSAGCSCWGIMNALDFIIIYFELLNLTGYIDKILYFVSDYYEIIKNIQKDHQEEMFKYKL